MVLQFGEFRFDPGSRQLLRDTKEIHLPPRTFRLLEVLLESSPKAIARDELMKSVWLGSRNGTWVRGVRVGAPVELHDGDAVILGTLLCVIRVHRAEESTRPAGDAARQ